MSSDPRLAPVLAYRAQVKDLHQASWSDSLDAEKRLVEVKFRGRITADDIARYAKSLLSRAEFNPTFSEIVDLTEATEIDLPASDFLKLADAIDPFWAEAKRAFVATTAVQNHAARLHKILRADRNIEIFESLEEARAWIDRKAK